MQGSWATHHNQLNPSASELKILHAAAGDRTQSEEMKKVVKGYYKRINRIKMTWFRKRKSGGFERLVARTQAGSLSQNSPVRTCSRQGGNPHFSSWHCLFNICLRVSQLTDCSDHVHSPNCTKARWQCRTNSLRFRATNITHPPPSGSCMIHKRVYSPEGNQDAKGRVNTCLRNDPSSVTTILAYSEAWGKTYWDQVRKSMFRKRSAKPDKREVQEAQMTKGPEWRAQVMVVAGDKSISMNIWRWH